MNPVIRIFHGATRCKDSRRTGARHCGISALSKKSQRKCFQVLLDALRVDSKELPRALQMIKDGISRETDTAALPAAARLKGMTAS